jgi:hypothetical protein
MSQSLKVEIVLSPIQVLDKHFKPCGVYSSDTGIPFAFSRPEDGRLEDAQYHLALVDGCLCFVDREALAPPADRARLAKKSKAAIAVAESQRARRKAGAKLQ